MRTELLDASPREGARSDAKLGPWRALGQTNQKVEFWWPSSLASGPSEAEKNKKVPASRSFGGADSLFPPLASRPGIHANNQNQALGARRRASKRSARLESPRGKKAIAEEKKKRKNAPENVPSPRLEVLLLPLFRRAAGGASARPARAQSCIARRIYSLRTSTCGFVMVFFRGVSGR